MFDAKYFKTFCYLYKFVLKIKSAVNDNSKTVYGVTKSSIFVSDEKVKTNQDWIFFSICIYSSQQKNSLVTANIHYLWNGMTLKV